MLEGISPQGSVGKIGSGRGFTNHERVRKAVRNICEPLGTKAENAHHMHRSAPLQRKAGDFPAVEKVGAIAAAAHCPIGAGHVGQVERPEAAGPIAGTIDWLEARSEGQRIRQRETLPPDDSRVFIRLDKIVRLIEPAMFQVRKNQDHPVGPIFRNMVDDPGTARTLACRLGIVARWQRSQCVMMAVQRDSDLLQVVCALDTACSLTSALNGRQQNPNQYSEDRNDHQELPRA